MGLVEPLHSSFSSVVMFTNKMNMIKPFILLCFLYGVILIAAVVAGEPSKDEEKGTNGIHEEFSGCDDVQGSRKYILFSSHVFF
ncbi:hypothetical protein HKD37_02G005702 [Glycine soja]